MTVDNKVIIMIQIIGILSNPEEALNIKANIASRAFIDPIEAICERSITLCYIFKSYLTKAQIVNHHVCNLIWQLQGNTDLLNLYLKKYLISSNYILLDDSIKKVWKLCSEVITHYTNLYTAPTQSITDTLRLVRGIKRFFIDIKTYCYRLDNFK